jgi:hypothetical protein
MLSQIVRPARLEELISAFCAKKAFSTTITHASKVVPPELSHTTILYASSFRYKNARNLTSL